MELLEVGSVPDIAESPVEIFTFGRLSWDGLGAEASRPRTGSATVSGPRTARDGYRAFLSIESGRDRVGEETVAEQIWTDDGCEEVVVEAEVVEVVCLG